MPASLSKVNLDFCAADADDRPKSLIQL